MTDGTNPVIDGMAEAFFRVSGQQIGRTDLSYAQLPEEAKDKVRECAKAAYEVVQRAAPPANPVIVDLIKRLRAPLPMLPNKDFHDMSAIWRANIEAAVALEAMPDVVGLREAVRKLLLKARKPPRHLTNEYGVRCEDFEEMEAALAKVSGVSK